MDSMSFRSPSATAAADFVSGLDFEENRSLMGLTDSRSPESPAATHANASSDWFVSRVSTVRNRTRLFSLPLPSLAISASATRMKLFTSTLRSAPYVLTRNSAIASELPGSPALMADSARIIESRSFLSFFAAVKACISESATPSFFDPSLTSAKPILPRAVAAIALRSSGIAWLPMYAKSSGVAGSCFMSASPIMQLALTWSFSLGFWIRSIIGLAADCSAISPSATDACALFLSGAP